LPPGHYSMPPTSGYPSNGCSPAEPFSVSPDTCLATAAKIFFKTNAGWPRLSRPILRRQKGKCFFTPRFVSSSRIVELVKITVAQKALQLGQQFPDGKGDLDFYLFRILRHGWVSFL
jgi:hypothetical protein